MRRGTALSIVLGLALGSAAGAGEILRQTDWLDPPEIVEVDITWQPIPLEIIHTWDEVRTDWKLEGITAGAGK